MFRTFCSNPSLGGFGSESSAPFARTSDREGDDDDRNAATPDAFCQIIKELVDNAVDACCAVSSNTETVLFTAPKKPPNGQCGAPTTCAPASSRNSAKRVRIVIETFQDKSSSSSSSSQAISTDSIGAKRQKGEILRVTVSDNGCGMDDIQACVGAFHSSKGQHSASQRPTRTGAIPTGKSQKTNISKTTNTTTTKKSTLHRHPSPSEDVSSPPEAQTAGRYGIGLTLCLLHAQRLVPDSCASIQSATMLDAQWAVVAAVVDMASDAVRCLPRPSLAKGYAQESGTAISVLVPGGSTARMAWPRLAEYFARFKLSRGVTCSLEVLAPTLSRVPLWVQTTDANINPMAMMVGEANGQGVKTEKMDLDLFDDCRKKSQSPCRDKPNKNKQKDSPSAERLSIWKATQRFLGQNINLMNVANVCVPIKIKSPGTNRRAKPNDPSSPTMEVAVVVHGRAEDDDDELVVDDSEAESDLDSDSDPDEVDSFTGDTLTRSKDSFTDSSASMVLVRMVNKIPLLDSAEAVACGLVQGISSKKRMWNSFGLEVRMKHDGTNVGKLPTFEVRDSDQVAPFFKTGAHCLFEESQDKTASPGVGVNKRKSRSIRRTLLPASVRLGNVLVIAQIHAEPSTLPLPTLSKGRLPIDNIAIDDALEVGMTACLRQLQKTNPSLLLTATELREAERDARYVPAVATALASILTKSVAHSDPSTIARIQSWGSSSSLRKNVVTPCSDDDSCVYPATQFGQAQHSLSIESLRDSIEGRLRLVLDESKKNKGKKKKLHQAEELSQASEGLDIDGTITRAASACLDQGNETPLEDYADNVAVIPKKSNGTKKPDKSELDYEDWL